MTCQSQQQLSRDGLEWVEDQESLEWLRANVTPVIVVAAQWFPEPSLQPWERLWLRVLIDAILEYAATWMDRPPTFRKMPSRRQRELRRKGVLAWFRGGAARIRFKEICEHFKIVRRTVWGVLGEIEDAGKWLEAEAARSNAFCGATV